jgi:nitroreductase
MHSIFEVIRRRHSSRMPFDRARPIPEQDMRQILEAARWAPTAHNMQNFSVIVVEDRDTLAAIAALRSEPSETFLRENYLQLSFSEEEFLRKKTGLLASMFPPSWRTPNPRPEEEGEVHHAFLGRSLRSCPTLLVVLYDTGKRAPASEGDLLGIMSLGCIMQNIWLMAESLGIAMQVVSAMSGREVEADLRRILGFPSHMAVAFGCRLGYPASGPARYLRVRREVPDFAHRDRFGGHGFA